MKTKIIALISMLLISFSSLADESGLKNLCMKKIEKHLRNNPEPIVYGGGPLWIKIYEIKNEDVCTVSYETTSPSVDCSDGNRVITLSLNYQKILSDSWIEGDDCDWPY